MRRTVRGILALAGASMIAWSMRLMFSQELTLHLMLFLVLSLPTAWLRLRIAPSTYLDLSPVLAFALILTSRPENAVVLAVLSALIGSLLLAGRTAIVSLSEVGEAGLAALAMVFTFRFLQEWIGYASGYLVPFVGSFLCYLITRFGFAATLNNLEENISLRAFARGPGLRLVTNLVVLAFAALGLSYLASAYVRIGYFAPALATVSLVEFYYPYKLLSDQEEALYAGLGMIAQAIDAKDPYTARHSVNVASVAARIARVLGLGEGEVRKIRIGALLHDIGKVGVKGAIIRKPGSLEAEEGAAMRQHPVIGAEIMEPVEFLREASRMVRYHHEHYDGSGYPDGLRAEEIPLGSRIILVADAFDAIITDRPYRSGRSKLDAVRILREHSGRQFDPQVVAALESVLDLI